MADFEDGKDDGALRTIGEVSEALKIKPHVLRYWEQQFSLLKPLKRSGGRRYYRPDDVVLVERINQLVNEEGYTLKGAEAVLRSSGAASGADRRRDDRRAGDRRAAAEPEGGIAAPVPDLRPKVEEAITQLKSIRVRLARAIEA
ncbi:MAG: MerR family transcriptional regulator [Pseudomonadota bacterium]